MLSDMLVKDGRDRTTTRADIVKVKTRKNACNFSLKSKYGIARNSVNAVKNSRAK